MLTVAVTSFNLAQRKAPLLGALAAASAAAPFDILAVAVQELAPFAEQMRRSHATRLSPAMRRIVAAFDSELGGTAICAAALEHGAVGLAVWVRPSIYPAQTPTYSKTGLGPLALSSKAAIAVALRLGSTGSSPTVAFVSAHLPAGVGPAADFARNRAFRAAATRLDFGGRSLFDCHSVFFAGDLNYRAGLSASFADDELCRSMRRNAAFPAFTESDVNFSPTYKLLASGTYNPCRNPAWCDRILTYARNDAAVPRIAAWREARPAPDDSSSLDSSITCLRYWSLPVAGSDHLPVYARFRLNLSCLANYDADIPAIADPLRIYYLALGFIADRSAGVAYYILTDPAALLLLLVVFAALARTYCC
ncbi:Inositol-1,4,5-trisphosphate 5-phosphatase 1 [Coemansia furcata]|uniref:Inositol-1,4,5-trisphosphate 5-phosphatase 1 n=1 Tax=Coemansia furcata TaxID=417177 RepID=A0ACC1L3H7_9FUNG|nr:Inositol-1,4,5-trisphosphate 5-phosphatase 1 [Coemansia furcata]